MSHIANQRIKKGGKLYRAGEPIELTEDDLAELPEGAASPVEDDTDNAAEGIAEVASKLKDALEAVSTDPEVRAKRLNEAVSTLTEDDFKKDGEIRADALRALNERLGFEVTAEDVSAAVETVNG